MQASWCFYQSSEAFRLLKGKNVATTLDICLLIWQWLSSLSLISLVVFSEKQGNC